MITAMQSGRRGGKLREQVLVACEAARNGVPVTFMATSERSLPQWAEEELRGAGVEIVVAEPTRAEEET